MAKKSTKSDRTTLDASLANLRAQGVPFVPLASLRRRSGNPRDNAEAVPAMVATLLELGWTDPILVAPDGEIEAGDTRYLAASHLGLEEVPILRTVHDERDARRHVVSHNRIGEIATWNPIKLAAMLDGFSPGELEPVGFTAEDIAAMLRGPDDGTTRGRVQSGPDDDDREPAPTSGAEPITKPGDLWICGEHRVACGDSTKEETLARVMRGDVADLAVTDPPFAIYGSATGIAASIADDRMTIPFFEAVCRALYRSTRWFAHEYLLCDWRSYPAIREGARRAKLEPKNLLVWDKGGGGLGSSYANCHELVGFFAKIPEAGTMSNGQPTGQRVVHKPNLIRCARASGADRPHNASKPLALIRELIENSSDEGEIVIDLFGGGGSTLIAAEQTKRVARMVDEDPAWVDVMVGRWERFTGRKATHIPALEAASGDAPPNLTAAPTRRSKWAKP